ncbi:MAG: NAD(P)H-hydrate epimerase [Bacteroidetes bacterium]|nr:NAD(P)H-hydrate epimerase [Bacteroidota bacterium]
MKILSSEQVRELDQYSIKNEPISSINLMERAALKFAQALHNDQNNSHKIYVFCGMGNNGGDGLAVARLLLSKYNYNLQVYVVGHMKEASPDFQKNEKKMEGVHYIKNKEDIPPIEKDACVIDALFGTGLSRPVEGIVASVIQAINQSGAYVYSIDMPSGLYCDQQNESRDAIIQADKVYTFHAPKLSFFFPSNGNYVRSFEILDIGLNQEFEKNLNSDYSFITVDMPRQFLKKREKFSHKGSYGHALIAAGSMGKMGAAILALKGAQRSGAGFGICLCSWVWLFYCSVASARSDAGSCRSSTNGLLYLEGKINPVR